MPTKIRKSAEVFSPGYYIRELLQDRGWTPADLAAVLKRPLPAINDIINGKRRITIETAMELSLAFGTSVQLWLNLENTYRIATAVEADPEIARRAKRLEREKAKA